MNAYELADELTKMFRGEEYDRLIHEIPDMLRQQKNEIEDLINAHRFVQNFAEEQHKRAVALESELDRAVELYTDKAIKVEQLEKELTEAGGMIGVLREYISDLENGLDSSIKLNKAQAERQVKELTDEEIIEIGLKLRIATTEIDGNWSPVVLEFARAILRKAQEK